MREQNTKIFGGLDSDEGAIDAFSSPLCIDSEPRGAELAPRRGYARENSVSMGGAILGIFPYISRYGEKGNIAIAAGDIYSDFNIEAGRVPYFEGVTVNATYSDGTSAYFVDGNSTRLRLVKLNGGAFTAYTLLGNYANNRAFVFEFGGNVCICVERLSDIAIVTFNGSALSLTDTQAAAGIVVYGVYVSAILSVALIFGTLVNFQFDGATISAGPAVIGTPDAIQGYTETATDIYMLQAGGVVQKSSGGAWSAHAVDIYVDPIYSLVKIGGVEYLGCVYSPGDTDYGIFSYDGSVLTRHDTSKMAFLCTDGTDIYSIDNSIFLFSGAPGSLSVRSYVTDSASTYGMQCSFLGADVYVVGGTHSDKTGVWAVRL